MTFLELCQTVRQEVGVSGTGPTTVLNQEGQLKVIVDFVADSDFQIQILWEDWEFLWAQYSSTLSTGVAAPAVAKPTDLGTWDMRSFYLDYTTNESAFLAPLSYIDWRSNYRQGVATANATVSPIPEQFHRAIVARAKTMWAEREEAPDILVGASAEYADVLDKLESNSLPVQRTRRLASSDTTITITTE